MSDDFVSFISKIEDDKSLAFALHMRMTESPEYHGYTGKDARKLIIQHNKSINLLNYVITEEDAKLFAARFDAVSTLRSIMKKAYCSTFCIKIMVAAAKLNLPDVVHAARCLLSNDISKELTDIFMAHNIVPRIDPLWCSPFDLPPSPSAPLQPGEHCE